MKTPLEISKLGREEFEKKWRRLWLHDGNMPIETYTSCEEEINSHILSQELALLKSIEEWAERRKRDENVKKIRENFDGALNKIEEEEQSERNKIYNKALSDLLAFLKEQGKLIKE